MAPVRAGSSYNDPLADFRRAVAGPASAVLVLDGKGEEPFGAVMVGHDGHRGWFYYLSVDPSRRRAGAGRSLVAAAEARVRERGVPKIQLMIRPGNPVEPFYVALGYEETPRTVMARWL